MSLIDALSDTFIIMDKTSIADGEGGFDTMWSEGAEVKACLTLDTTMQAKRAEREGVTSVYTLTTDKNTIFEFHTVLKRKKDGAIFRTTTNAVDKIAPSFSTLNMAQCSAEKWELPT